MPDGEHSKNHATAWAAVGKLVAPFLVGIASTAFFLGGRQQKTASTQQEILLWKAEVAPQIQRMDSKGTVAGERFSLEQGKELGRMEKRLEELEKEAKSIEAMKLKIEALDRAVARTPPR